jgi:hypothetical protein
MRLLERNHDGDFSLTRDLVGDSIPEYAILSHTWGPDTEEVTFENLVDGTGKDKAGYDKIRFCAKQAGCDGLRYFWVDTCCIDKSSSAELSEAINSMFKWYQQSSICYVYLADVKAEDLTTFEESRWFKRGWTLQELIAPEKLWFFDSRWTRLGGRNEFTDMISKITSIPSSLISTEGRSGRTERVIPFDFNIREPLSRFSVAAKMSWASNRSTTRQEDMAYCLLGIFDINMPLLYGEGGERAFLRLQDEIMKYSCDQSILAFEVQDEVQDEFWVKQNQRINYVAAHPKLFTNSGQICRGPDDISRKLRMINTNQGMEIDMLLCPAQVVSSRGIDAFDGWLALLDCSFSNDFTARPIILLRSIGGDVQDASIKRLYRWGSGVGRVCDTTDLVPLERFCSGWLKELIGK